MQTEKLRFLIKTFTVFTVEQHQNKRVRVSACIHILNKRPMIHSKKRHFHGVS